MTRLRTHLTIGCYLAFLALTGGFGKLVKAGALSWAVGKAETIYKKPAKAYLALCTVEVKYSNTGATITEATGATGYSRKEITFAEAVEGETAEIYNAAEETMAAITAGEAKVIGWALCDSPETGKGNLIAFGTCTETVISKTQSPPTVAAKALKVELK